MGRVAMQLKEAANAFYALMEALRSVFAPLARDYGDQQRSLYTASNADTPSSNEQELGQALTNSGWVIVGVLTLLILATLTLGIFDFSSFRILLSSERRSFAQWRDYQVSAVLLLLLLMEATLVFIVAFRDRKRQRMETLLRETEERMTFAAEAADIGLWEWYADNDRFWATEHCQQMFGIPPGAEYTMAAMTAAVHPDDLMKVSQTVNRGIETNSHFVTEYRLSLGSGQNRWVRVRGRPTRGANGRIARISGVIVNITERMRMKAEIDRQQQSLTHLTRVGVIGELSGALAHELNQPLTAILSNAQAVQRMIRQDTIDVAELGNAIADIIEDDSRAGDVIRHLRTLLKKEDVRHDVLPVNQVLSRALQLIRNDLNTRHIAVIMDLSREEPTIQGDAIQLQQLFLNLVLNAADAMSNADQSHGVIAVQSDISDEETVHISISDTGTGIRRDLIDKLFEPFFSTKKHGLGLGLSISRAIVNGHAGTITAENNIGPGSTFHVFLPRAKLETP